MKKILALVLALAMILTVSAAFASGEAETPAEPTFTVTKAEGISGNASITLNIPEDVAKQAVENTYKIYKVFDATSDGTSDNIAYTSRQGDSMPTGFVLDGQGNVHHGTKDAQTGAITENTATALTDAEITSIKGYVRDEDLVATVVVNGALRKFTVDGLPYGYYYITTTTGTVVTVDSTNPTATVDDKNSAPSLDKSITGGNDYTIDDAGKAAIAQVGTTVNYEVDIVVGTGMKNYTFHDKMSTGLEYIPSSLTVTGKVSKTDDTPVTVNYTLPENPEGGDTITVHFADGLAAGTVITVAYSATVTRAALTVDYEKNTAYLDYGDENSHNKTPEDETKVYAAKITVIKQDGQNKPLTGAKFKLKNSNGKWYKLDTVNGKPVVKWVDDEADADEKEATALKEDATDPDKITSCEAVFQGLPAGTYTLVETKVPDGYNKAADTSITVKKANEADALTVANLEQEATVVNNAGTELPSTGGIGTTIFYIVGGLLVLGAAIILITRRKAESK